MNQLAHSYLIYQLINVQRHWGKHMWAKDLFYILGRGSILIGGVLILLFVAYPFSLIVLFLFLIPYGILYHWLIENILNKINPSIEAKAAGDTCYEFFVGYNLTEYSRALDKLKGTKQYRNSITSFIVYTAFFWTILIALIFLVLSFRL